MQIRSPYPHDHGVPIMSSVLDPTAAGSSAAPVARRRTDDRRAAAIVRAGLSVTAGAGDHPVHAGRCARRAAAAGRAEAVGEVGPARRRREPRRRQHPDRHGRGREERTDGYTLLLAGDQTFVLNPLLYPTLPYSMKELDPIVLMASIPHMLAVATRCRCRT